MKKEPATDLAEITVDFGYDIHKILLTIGILKRILAGEDMCLQGQGFPVEGEMQHDRWHFNGEEPGSISVITEEGFDIYQGYLDDDEVWLDQPS